MDRILNILFNHLNFIFLTKLKKSCKAWQTHKNRNKRVGNFMFQVEGFSLEYNKQKNSFDVFTQRKERPSASSRVLILRQYSSIFREVSQLLQKLLFNILFINVVHASNISDLHLVISKRRIHPQIAPQTSRQSDNPYIFKPKSYSTKRNAHQDIPEKPLRSSPCKKVKRQKIIVKQSSPALLFQLGKIIEQTQRETLNYFQNSFFSRSKIQQEKNSSTNLGNCQSLLEKKLNPMIKNQITIVSNKNEKIQTLIHQGLLLSNTSHTKVGKDQHFLKDIINPFDFQRRDQYLKTIKFQKDYKSGYAPIQMQQKNVQEAEEGNNYEQSKTHFIRKKQSTLSLPRSCGVSYVKPSQSFQQAPFQPLPPLIFQCSSRCEQSRVCKQKYEDLSNLFNQISFSSWFPYIQTTQDQMRNLLLGKRVGHIGWVKGIQNLWPLFTQSAFFLIIVTAQNCITNQSVWKAYGQSPFKIGILAKKSTSGKKAFLKSLNIKQNNDDEQKNHTNEQKQKNTINQHQPASKFSQQNTIPFTEDKTMTLEETIANQLKDCRTVITLSLRLQMYVEENQWKSASKQQKDMLNYLINNLKDYLEKGSLEIIKKRLNLNKPQYRNALISQALLNLRINEQKYQGIECENLQKSRLVFNQKQLKSLFQQKSKIMHKYQHQLIKITKNMPLQQLCKLNKSELIWEKTLKMPLYYISTRDSFAFDLVQKVSYLKRDTGRIYKKIQYFFEPDNLPTNFGKQYRQKFPEFNVGVNSYHDFFTQQELKQFENNTFETQVNAFKNKFLQMTVQPSIVGTKIKRTKFFFGYRYMWTRCQLAEPGSYIGAGVRKDVTQRPKWTQKIINQFVKSSIAQKDFINSIAINVYHDGKQGLAQHFDDAVRFKQPIYTVRLFSDARLSFGSQFYGFCNGAFIIPLPRGCICVMEENSYAANGVKHCVRPCDMTGKSAAVILRQMHSKVVSQAKKYDELIDFPAWVSCLSNEPEAVTYAQQKRRQSEYLLANTGLKEELAK